ncbi:MAG: PilZ domain-containing protein [Gammaproteobacteria bacterium]|nr:PilZ domain-containing protein [Gammaproteobacteria bacterium]
MSGATQQQLPVPVNRTAHLYSKDGTHFRSDLTNISMKRIGILHQVPLTTGTPYKVQFSLHLGNAIKKICVLATVTHKHIRNNQHYIVLRIVKVDPQHLNAIQQYYNDKRAGLQAPRASTA